MTAAVLVAGIGNVFLGDDGFGVEVVQRLQKRALPGDVQVVDVGIRGVHLAHQLLDGYELVVLVDAMARGEVPGTLSVLEVSPQEPSSDDSVPLMDAHSLAPDAVLRLVSALSGDVSTQSRVIVVGCEPESIDVGLGLSAVVADAVDPAVELVSDLLAEFVDGGGTHGATAAQVDRDRSRGGDGDSVAARRRPLPALAGDVKVPVPNLGAGST